MKYLVKHFVAIVVVSLAQKLTRYFGIESVITGLRHTNVSARQSRIWIDRRRL